MPRLLLALIAIIGVVAVACGDSDDSGAAPEGPQLFPAAGNTELVVGPNRFAFGLTLEDQTRILDADVFLRFFFGEELKHEQRAGFTWAISDVVGFYIANVDFDAAGQWTAEAVATLPDGSESIVTFTFPVTEEGVSPTVGQPAPASDSPTLSTEPNIKKLSSDQDPDPALYETSIADAVELGKPAVIIFATPAFCTSRFCGPVLDNVKDVKRDFVDSVTFIHVEPFVLDDDGAMVQEDGIPAVAKTTLEWNLVTEPWVFILDADGIISSRFEGTASAEELTVAINGALG